MVRKKRGGSATASASDKDAPPDPGSITPPAAIRGAIPARAPASDSKCYSRKARRRTRQEEEEEEESPSASPARPPPPQSCPPAIPAKRRKVQARQAQTPPSISGSSKKNKLKLPEEFVRQQKDYFAEIDAFELQEAEAGADDDDERPRSRSGRRGSAAAAPSASASASEMSEDP